MRRVRQDSLELADVVSGCRDSLWSSIFMKKRTLNNLLKPKPASVVSKLEAETSVSLATEFYFLP